MGARPEVRPGGDLSRLAPAKVNLSLQILGRRPDGYHELESLIVFAAVGDFVTVKPGTELSLTLAGRFGEGLRAEPDNLVLRAARALDEAAQQSCPGGLPRGAAIRLHKELPVAAGLGGGSADAAATLVLLSQLWKLELGPDKLQDIALALGADVPVCLHGRSALVRGLGERIEEAPTLPPLWLVLVNPGLALPTPQVFAARQGPFSRPERWPQRIETAERLAKLLRGRSNDLEPAAATLAPVIPRMLEALASCDGCLLARMSGSGATGFGLFAQAGKAERAAGQIAAAYPQWWVVSSALAEQQRL